MRIWAKPYKSGPREGRLYCSRCHQVRYWERKSNDPEGLKLKQLKNRLITKYKMTLEEFYAMVEKQDNKCAICLQPETHQKNGTLSVDHDHDTGKIRDLLCDRCNNGIGCFRENPEFLARAVAYLNKHKKENN